MKQILHNFAMTSMTVKRNLLSSVFILVFLSANGQNGIIGTGFTNGWNSTDIISFTAGAGSSRISTLQPKGTSDRFFRLVRNWSGNLSQFGPFGCVDTPWNNPGVTYGMSPCGNGAFSINCPNTTDNYVFKTPNGDTATTLLYFRVQGDVRTISSVTQFPVAANVAPCSGTTVTANLSGALSTGQAVYLRYTKDAYATSTVIPLTGSGTTYTGTIPLAFNTLNANVSYYVFTSGTTTPSAADADLYTINLNNNAGANYTYTVTTATTSTWNGSSWSTCTPTASIDAIISADYSTSAVAPQGPFSAKSVTVNPTITLTIATGTNVTVQNAVVNNGTLTVENNANLIQANNVTNSGVVTVRRNSNALKRSDYTLWSSPVADQNLLAFSPLTTATRFYSYDNSTGTSGLFSAITSPSTTPFTNGSGYLIRMPNTDPLAGYDDGNTPLTFQGVFTGIPNNGNIPVTLNYGVDAAHAYNLVGNPYPSTLDANTFITANTANIESTLYFWRKTNGSGTAYAAYNPAGGVLTYPSTTSGTPSGTIQVGQGFFVQAKSAGTVTNFFTNAMRLGTSSTQFFKTKQVAQKDRVWLNLTSTSGVFSQALIGYISDASLGLDIYDGKYINDSPIALTSNINNEEYTIQGRPTFDATDVVALNFKTDVAGDYSIAIDHVDGLFSGSQYIYLVDSKTGSETNLKTSSYTFTATAGVDNTRFSLKYQKTLGLAAQVLNDNSVIVYKNNGVIYVNSGAKTIKNIKVFDIQGRVLAERNNVKANTTSIQNLNVSNQIVVVKVTTNDNQVISKKVEN